MTIIYWHKMNDFLFVALGVLSWFGYSKQTLVLCLNTANSKL